MNYDSSYAKHKSFICGTQFIHTWDMIDLCLGQNSYKFGNQFRHTCNMWDITHLYVWDDAFIWGTWFIHIRLRFIHMWNMWDIAHSNVCDNSSIRVDLRICSYGSFICETRVILRIQMCATTHPYMWTSESGHICHGCGTAWRVRRQGVPNTRTHKHTHTVTHTHTHTHIHTHTHMHAHCKSVVTRWQGIPYSIKWDLYSTKRALYSIKRDPYSIQKINDFEWNRIERFDDGIGKWLKERYINSKCVMNWSFNVWIKWVHNNQPWYGVASISRLLKIIGLFCKIDL